jgi:hypothetical protein
MGFGLPTSKTAWNSVQRSLASGQDPASPGLVALMSLKKKSLQAIFSEIP